jgi:hypothetical protein
MHQSGRACAWRRSPSARCTPLVQRAGIIEAPAGVRQRQVPAGPSDSAPCWPVSCPSSSTVQPPARACRRGRPGLAAAHCRQGLRRGLGRDPALGPPWCTSSVLHYPQCSCCLFVSRPRRPYSLSTNIAGAIRGCARGAAAAPRSARTAPEGGRRNRGGRDRKGWGHAARRARNRPVRAVKRAGPAPTAPPAAQPPAAAVAAARRGPRHALLGGPACMRLPLLLHGQPPSPVEPRRRCRPAWPSSSQRRRRRRRRLRRRRRRPPPHRRRRRFRRRFRRRRRPPPPAPPARRQSGPPRCPARARRRCPASPEAPRRPRRRRRPPRRAAARRG